MIFDSALQGSSTATATPPTGPYAAFSEESSLRRTGKSADKVLVLPRRTTKTNKYIDLRESNRQRIATSCDSALHLRCPLHPELPDVLYYNRTTESFFQYKANPMAATGDILAAPPNWTQHQYRPILVIPSTGLQHLPVASKPRARKKVTRGQATDDMGDVDDDIVLPRVSGALCAWSIAASDH